MSTAPIITDLQSINPSAVIELFELTTDATLHGSTQTYRFHAGSNLNLNGKLVFGGNEYLRFPVSAEGFAYQRGQIPRPSLSVSNALGTITAILLNVNAVTTGNDLTGATVKRIRTTARYIDAVNFPVTTTSSTTTSTIADPADAESVTYTVTVVNVGGSNYFAINGSTNPVITMKRGSTYTFNQSHSSNVGHPLRIKSDAGGQQTTTNTGTLGTDASVVYQPAYPTAPSDLRYYCTVHGNGMGNTITMNNPNTTTQTTTTTSTQQVNPLGTPDATAKEVITYTIARKSAENRDIVSFELAAPFDLAGVRVGRQCTRDLFPSIGTFIA
jgi:lambda family phage minor tail protein L